MADFLGLLAWSLWCAAVILLTHASLDEFSPQAMGGGACSLLALYAAEAKGERQERDRRG